jgi:tetratricopeptide (TPR) repeat protein
LILVAQDTASHDRQEARQILDQAAQIIEEGKRLQPDYAEYGQTEQLLQLARRDIEGQPVMPPAGDLLQELTQLLAPLDEEKDTIAALVGRGISLRQKGDMPGALELLERAWQQAPNRFDVQDELIATLAPRVEQLEAENAHTQCAQLIATWHERLADNPKVAARLNFARWIPRLKRDLESSKFIYHQGTQEFMLPFDADTLGTVMIRLTVEDELLGIMASLPLPSLDDEAALSNLLQVTGDFMFYKVCSFETTSLALAAYVPLASLPAARLELLARSLSRYADISPSSLNQMESLHNHAHVAREVNQMNASALELPPQDWCAVQALVQDRGWRWEQVGDQADLFGPPGMSGEQAHSWRVETDFDGVRLSADLGYLRAGGDQLDLLRRLLRLNGALGLGKLTLTADARLRLAVELPVVDRDAFETAIRVLEAESARLRRDLTQS